MHLKILAQERCLGFARPQRDEANCSPVPSTYAPGFRYVFWPLDHFLVRKIQNEMRNAQCTWGRKWARVGDKKRTMKRGTVKVRTGLQWFNSVETSGLLMGAG